MITPMHSTTKMATAIQASVINVSPLHAWGNGGPAARPFKNANRRSTASFRPDVSPVSPHIGATVPALAADHTHAELQDERIVGQFVGVPDPPIPAIHA